MKKRMISVRIKNGWTKRENKSLYTCDVCGRRLWKSPANVTYCDGNGTECGGNL